MAATWDPALYLTFSNDRSRPFFDLLARVGADRPEHVVDLGCGPGGLTATLTQRWPDAEVVGVDSSPSMIGAARQRAGDRLSFRLADLRDWRPEPAPDVIVSNATLQWLPDHRQQIRRLVRALAPCGWLAFQVPGNLDAPSHRLLYELSEDPRFAAYTTGLERPASADPATYLADLTADRPTVSVDAWETTYLHVLAGPDPVFDWISGTGARPTLQALPDDLRAEFATEYRARLRQAYPVQEFGTAFPFRRVFLVAHRLD